MKVFNGGVQLLCKTWQSSCNLINAYWQVEFLVWMFDGYLLAVWLSDYIKPCDTSFTRTEIEAEVFCAWVGVYKNSGDLYALLILFLLILRNIRYLFSKYDYITSLCTIWRPFPPNNGGSGTQSCKIVSSFSIPNLEYLQAFREKWF